MHFGQGKFTYDNVTVGKSQVVKKLLGEGYRGASFFDIVKAKSSTSDCAAFVLHVTNNIM